MKKLFAILICAIMCVTLLASCDSEEHEHTMSDWKHNETEHWKEPVCGRNNCSVQAEVHELGEHVDKNYDGVCDVCGREEEYVFVLNYDKTGYKLSDIGPAYKGGDVVIPSEYRGLPIVEIGYSAFTSDYKLTSVVIPDTVTLIDGDAFEKQPHLTNINVGKGVVTIGVSAFERCTNVVISDTTEYIYAGAFKDCTSLETVTLGKNVKEITGYVFRGCTSLKTITIPASIVEMGAWVFEDTNMTDVYFGVSAPGENWHEEWADGLESVNLHWAEAEE